MTHLSLFTGIGGIDIAAEWAGFETVGQCEFADFPTKVLEKHWPDVPRWRDIRDVTADSFFERTGLHTIDLISGGFPCQPFSVAGKQKGERDERHLWPEMLRVIQELRPSWVLGENVSGILRLAGDAVCEGLEREGYDVGILNFEAAAVGAPHRRARVFFVGNAKHDGQLAHTELRSHETASHDRGQEEPCPAKQPPGTGKPAHVRGVHGSKDGSERRLGRRREGGRLMRYKICGYHGCHVRSQDCPCTECGTMTPGSHCMESCDKLPALARRDVWLCDAMLEKCRACRQTA